MLAKPCSVCGKPGKATCDECRLAKQALHPKPRRQQRGYDSLYDRNRRIVIDTAIRENQNCCICNLPFSNPKDITAEHLIPRRQGGSSELTNLGPAHSWCNYGWNRKRQPRHTIERRDYWRS